MKKSKDKMKNRYTCKKPTDISIQVKLVVALRDNGKCVNCGNKRGVGKPNAHFIPRRLGGLGIEENILDLCDVCHTEFDKSTGEKKKQLECQYEEYLRLKYKCWDREKLVLKGKYVKKCYICGNYFTSKRKKKAICLNCYKISIKKG